MYINFFTKNIHTKNAEALLKYIDLQRMNIEKASMEQYTFRKHRLSSLGFGLYLKEIRSLPPHLLGLASLESDVSDGEGLTKFMHEIGERGWMLSAKRQ
jgi:hypothetical protein